MSHQILFFRLSSLLCLLLLTFGRLNAAHVSPMPATHHLYIIPGQGADHRAFQFLEWPEGVEVHILEFLVPESGELMPSYARRMAAQIDTTHPFSLMGASLGGMIAIEMNSFLTPEKTIILSSIKGRQEMPGRYKILRYVPLHRVFGGSLYIWATNVFRPYFEPEGAIVDDLARQMLADKDPRFMKRAIHCIVNWDNTEVPPNLLHIHGEKDHTLPFKCVADAVEVKGGSHMIVMTRPEEVSAIINDYLQRG